MKKTAAPLPTSTNSNAVQGANSSNNDYRRVFLAAVLSMSWQLALVVLLPVLGGFSIDKHFHTQPLWTIVGFVIAIVGVVTVIKRMFNLVNGGGKA